MAIELPAGLSEKWKKPEDFILNLDTWEDYDPDFFLKALELVNPFLAALAKEIPYLTAQPTAINETDEIRREIRRLVSILRNRIAILEWKIILKPYEYKIEDAFNFKKVSKFCIQSGIVQRNFKILIKNLEKVKRNDLAEEVLNYQQKLSTLTEDQFFKYFNEEASL